jgi:MHS family alpha-ketoglutarate permease-like MFS transporter
MSTFADSISITGTMEATDRRRRIVAIIGASSGNLVEWYDFYAYAFTSIYFASAFFPTGDSTSQLLGTAGIFAVGFFMRPLGGWLFGWIADTHGRRRSVRWRQRSSSLRAWCRDFLSEANTAPLPPT